ncbi:hypothetical protein A1019T_01671 [Psychrobacter pasteurii]|uniref:Uncharacterized protein n=1 Tax=Psychrobacter pasteurii TaxID=1945520 RepID=A0A1R4EGN7_9GAMM|nr:hypothetical protein A1019T_01671 [Psychrobacter pasteurii]
MLSMARLILAYNPLTTSYDSVCRLISTPEIGGFTATGDKRYNMSLILTINQKICPKL